MRQETIFSQTNNLHSSQFSKEYKNLLILANVDLVFNVVEALNSSLDEDELLCCGMDAFVKFVNEGNYTKSNFEEEATKFIRDELEFTTKLQ